MSIDSIRPSTLDGIKRLAKSIKQERGVQHVRALDAAAQAGGFQNFRHAQNALPRPRTVPPVQGGHFVYLTAYWRDAKAGTSGRETLALVLSAPAGNLVTPQQLLIASALSAFRQEGPDHLANGRIKDSQSRARASVTSAARMLQFMDATKLRPSKAYSRAWPRSEYGDQLPGRDHSAVWYDPKSKRYLVTDEPYDQGANHYVNERAAWAQRHGFAIAKATWAGMYYPDGGARLYLVTDSAKGVPLEPVIAALNQLPPPPTETSWNGVSAPSSPLFVSPGTLAKVAGPATPAAPKQPPPSRGSAVRYQLAFGGRRQRPNGKMPVAAHVQVGKLLKSVLADSYHRKGVHSRVDSARCTLDDWAQLEYSQAELPNADFFKLYYNATGTTFAKSLSPAQRATHVGSLVSVRSILSQHYPDSNPLRALLKTIDQAIKSMQSWK